jgi:hypothetical protein
LMGKPSTVSVLSNFPKGGLVITPSNVLSIPNGSVASCRSCRVKPEKMQPSQKKYV